MSQTYHDDIGKPRVFIDVIRRGNGWYVGVFVLCDRDVNLLLFTILLNLQTNESRIFKTENGTVVQSSTTRQMSVGPSYYLDGRPCGRLNHLGM